MIKYVACSKDKGVSEFTLPNGDRKRYPDAECFIREPERVAQVLKLMTDLSAEEKSAVIDMIPSLGD